MLCSFVSEHKELLENAKVVVFFYVREWKDFASKHCTFSNIQMY